MIKHDLTPNNNIDTIIFFVAILLQNMNFYAKRFGAKNGFKGCKLQDKKIKTCIRKKNIDT